MSGDVIPRERGSSHWQKCVGSWRLKKRRYWPSSTPPSSTDTPPPFLLPLSQVLPFYSCSLDQESQAEAASAHAQPPSEALAKVRLRYTQLTLMTKICFFFSGYARVWIIREFLEAIQ